jgi:hypothetical protein
MLRVRKRSGPRCVRYERSHKRWAQNGNPYKGEIISRNITPDKNGLPARLTLTQFTQIFRTGVDLDHAHPSCSATVTTNCLSFPINGNLLQVMPWPAFQSMTDRHITAIYTYLSAIPCLEGGPGEGPCRCQ